VILQENYLTNPVSGEEGERPSPYADGMFQVRLQLSSNYPNTAPKVSKCSASGDNFRRKPLPATANCYHGENKKNMQKLIFQIVFKTRVFHPAIDAKEGKVRVFHAAWRPLFLRNGTAAFVHVPHRCRSVVTTWMMRGSQLMASAMHWC